MFLKFLIEWLHTDWVPATLDYKETYQLISSLTIFYLLHLSLQLLAIIHLFLIEFQNFKHTSDILACFRIWRYLSLCLNPYYSKVSCMFHKESMEMPLTTKNLVCVTSACAPRVKMEAYMCMYAEEYELKEILATKAMKHFQVIKVSCNFWFDIIGSERWSSCTQLQPHAVYLQMPTHAMNWKNPGSCNNDRPGLISCAGVTGSVGITCRAHTIQVHVCSLATSILSGVNQDMLSDDSVSYLGG